MTSADRRQRIVDFMHDPGGKLANGSQLLALHDLPLNSTRLGHVLPDGNDMADPVSFQAHGDLAQPEGANLPAESDLELILDDLPGLKHTIEFPPHLPRRLP